MKLEFIEEWPTVLWRSASTRTTALLTFIAGALAQYYMAGFAFLAFMPPEIQIPAGGAILFGLLGLPLILSRIIAQPKMAAKVEEKQAEKLTETGGES
jgi:hypothetical protein